MLRISADIFSGRPNPAWVLTDESEARATLRALAQDPGVLADEAPPDAGLGFRGLRIEPLGDELAADYGIRGSSYLAVGAYAGSTRAPELAARLIDLAARESATVESGADTLPIDGALQDFLTAQLEEATRLEPNSQTSVSDQPGAPSMETTDVEAAVTCFIEQGAFNPGFWNNDATTRLNNNCYNYASNWRTNTFAQPGRGCGRMYTAITCPEVTRAALCDGMHHRYNCFPDSEKPRYLVALVVAPGPGFVDYHWYRKQKEGYWGHKPGGTAARNYDNSGVVISDPQFCNRGFYSLFCGYFYGCNSQRMRIR